KTYEKQVIIYTAACHGIVHVLELTYGAVLVSIAKELGVTFTVLGLLANVFGFTFGLSALPFGLLADRTDPKRLLIVCCLGTAIAAAFVGLAPNTYLLGVALFFLGLMLGIYHPTGTSYISRAVSRRSLGFGYQGVGGNLGIALGPLMAGGIAYLLSWRASYLIFAIPPLILALLIYLVRQGEAEPEPANPVESGQKEKASLKPYRLPLAFLFSAQVMLAFVYRSLVTFMPAYLAQQRDRVLPSLDPQLFTGYVSTFVLLFGVVGQLLAGYLAERVSHETLGVLINLLGVPFLLLIGTSQGLTLIVIAAIYAFLHFMGQPVYNSLVADYSPQSQRGLIFGTYFFLNFGLGSFSATLMGLVADRMGLARVFVLASAFALASCGFIFPLTLRTIRERRSR
ncbi:MAG: MFS transporter, partial [Chloroflexota bacterium]